MKKISIYFISAVLLFSCTNKELVTPVNDNGINFSTEVVETKTAFGTPDAGKYPTLWTENSTVKLSLNLTENVEAEVTPSADGKSASLKADFTSSPEGYQFYGFAPSAAVSDIDTEAFHFTVSASQASLPNSVDEAAQILYAKSEYFEVKPQSVALSFKHLVAYAKVSVSNINSELISSIKFSSEDAILAGTATYNVPADEVYAPLEGSKSITVSVSEPASTVWFATLPTDALGKCTLTVTTTAGNTYSREIDLAGKTFATGVVAKFTVEMPSSTLPEADLLDVEFNLDGTASDISAHGATIQTLPSSHLAVVYNDLLGKNVANFLPDYRMSSYNSNMAGGFYKYDYSADTTFKEAFEDGHTMECVFAVADATFEQKIFSSTAGGGASIIITDWGSESGYVIEYYIGAGETKSSWIQCVSSINPVPGRFYHVMGVYDKDNQKIILYVDGENVAENSTSGKFWWQTSTGGDWFGIGCDSGAGLLDRGLSFGETGFDGTIASAKMYSTPLSATQVKAIYDAQKVSQVDDANAFSVKTVSFPQSYITGNQSIFRAENFKDGDAIRLVKCSDGTVTDVETKYWTFSASNGGLAGTCLTTNMPSSLTDGEYYAYVVRNGSKRLLGKIYLMSGINTYDQKKMSIVDYNSDNATGDNVQKSIDGNWSTQWQRNWTDQTDHNVRHKMGDNNYYTITYKTEEEITLKAVRIGRNSSGVGRADLKSGWVYTSLDNKTWELAAEFNFLTGRYPFGGNDQTSTWLPMTYRNQAQYVKIVMDDSWRIGTDLICNANIIELYLGY